MASTGRNDPCPCGSGRKYKHCCLRAAELVDHRAVRLRSDEGTVVPKLLEFAAEYFGTHLLDEAWGRFCAAAPDPSDAEADLDRQLFEALFVPWFLFEFVPHPHPRPRRPRRARVPLATVAAAFLELFPHKLTASEREFVEAALGSALSYHLVTGVAPGRSIDLEDLLTGERRRVVEQSASKTVKPGAVLFARVVAVGESAIMSGCAPLLLPPLWRIEIVNLRDALAGRSRRRFGSEDVRRAADDLLALYHRAADEMLHPPPLKLVNTDGEPIAPVTLRFELRCPVGAAFDRLRTLSLWEGDDAMEDPEYDERGELRAVSIDWSKPGNRLHKEWDNTTLGHLTIDGPVLTASVNSRRRAARIRRQIERRLGADVSFKAEVHESLPAMRGERTMLDRYHTGQSVPAAGEVPPELQGALDEMLARRWEQWVDDRIPALGNLTPREAAQSEGGRVRLEALLDDYQWHNERRPAHLRVDVEHLKRLAGLPPR